MAYSSAFVSIQSARRSLSRVTSISLYSTVSPFVSSHNDNKHRLSSNDYVQRSYRTSSVVQKKAWDPSSEEYKYWNREESKKGEGMVWCKVYVRIFLTWYLASTIRYLARGEAGGRRLTRTDLVRLCGYLSVKITKSFFDNTIFNFIAIM